MLAHADQPELQRMAGWQLRIKGSNPFDASIKPQVNDSPAVKRCLSSVAAPAPYRARRIVALPHATLDGKEKPFLEFGTRPTAEPKTRFSAHRVDNGLTLAR